MFSIFRKSRAVKMEETKQRFRAVELGVMSDLELMTVHRILQQLYAKLPDINDIVFYADSIDSRG